VVKESQLEHRVLRHLDALRCSSETPYLRRCGMGDGFGAIDLVLLPRSGRRKMILVEAKRVGSADATCKVVGQLLMYYAAARAIGNRGVVRLQEYCESQGAKARSTSMKNWRTLVGGGKKDEAARLLRHGRHLEPNQVGLYLVFDKEPRATLFALVKALRGHGLSIGVVVAKSTGLSLRTGPSRVATRNFRKNRRT
jgi:hypothetical protein